MNLKIFRLVIVLFIFFGGKTISAQTTVTLEDQCNCEILKGTAVSNSGVSTPSGEDLGDLYVNTDSGTIFFWDGNTWELTSTDANTTNARFLVDISAGDLVLIDSANNEVRVSLSDIRNDRNIEEVLIQGNDANGRVLTGLGAPIADSDAATKAYVDAFSDNDFFAVGSATAPTNINDNIFTEGAMAIGKDNINTGRTLDIDGELEFVDRMYINGKQAIQGDTFLRLNPSGQFTSGVFLNSRLRVDNNVVINPTRQNFDFRVSGIAMSNLLIVDGSESRVGIGTGSPAALLDIEGGTLRLSDYGAGTITGTPASLLGVNVDGDVIEVTGSSFGGDADFYTVGTLSAPINSTDNIYTEGAVAIGKNTVTGGRALDVEGNIEMNDRLYMNGKWAIGGYDNFLRLDNNRNFSGGIVAHNDFRTLRSTILNNSSQDFDLIVRGVGEFNLLKVDASTNRIGIGMFNPSAKLDVDGNLRIRTLPNAVNTDQVVTADTNGNLRKSNVLKASTIFYPTSSINIDVATIGNNRIIDLYDEYLTQYSAPTASSAGAPASVPIYGPNELYYYVTYADPTVFDTDPTEFFISADGVLTYDVIATPTSGNEFINVIFVVR